MPAAAAVCINDNRQILMVLQGKPSEEKKWSVPGGGKEENESFEECCVREVWEETGYEVEIKQFIHSKANGLIRYFEVTLLGGSAKFHDPDDLIYDIAWKSLTELKDLIMTYDEDKDLLIELLTN
jgi:ADP-ribose pyrophosphatase YjhB (NUDIX family)